MKWLNYLKTRNIIVGTYKFDSQTPYYIIIFIPFETLSMKKKKKEKVVV